MELDSAQALIVLAAVRLRLGMPRLRLLVSGDDPSLCDWIGHGSVVELQAARAYAQRTALLLKSLGAQLVSLPEATYPMGLRRLADPPAFLTFRGNIDFGGIAIVGSRTPPAEALEFAFNVARELKVPTISGLAFGIDAAVHRGSLSARVPTVAYVGNGVSHTYPRAHHELQEQIIALGGGVASERLPEEEASPRTLVRRDRLQAAHARAVLLVSTEKLGGAMHTMRFARDLHVPRFAVQKRGAAYTGNREAIAGGATPVAMNVDDVVQLLSGASTV